MARNIAPQDVSWFLDLYDRERLDLTPPYQRKSVWTSKERKYFLDTVFNNYPCPPVFLYKSISDQGVSTFHVVDGKQRLETIINFAKNKLSMPSEFIDETLQGKKWRQLTIEQKKQFWNYQFAVEMLDVVDPATVKEIFGRYNRTSKNLDPQELRHAKFDGWFITYAETETNKDEWSRLGISTTGKARRMRDVQFVSELMIVILKNGVVSGFDQDEIDQYYADYDNPPEVNPNFIEEDFSSKFQRVKDYVLQIEAINHSVTLYAKSVTHFYTLWTVLASEQIGTLDINIIAQRYAEFMTKVTEVLNHDSPDQLLQGDGVLAYQAPFNYAQNARGANTEQPQRVTRYELLFDYLNH